MYFFPPCCVSALQTTLILHSQFIFHEWELDLHSADTNFLKILKRVNTELKFTIQPEMWRSRTRILSHDCWMHKKSKLLTWDKLFSVSHCCPAHKCKKVYCSLECPCELRRGWKSLQHFSSTAVAFHRVETNLKSSNKHTFTHTQICFTGLSALFLAAESSASQLKDRKLSKGERSWRAVSVFNCNQMTVLTLQCLHQREMFAH